MGELSGDGVLDPALGLDPAVDQLLDSAACASLAAVRREVRVKPVRSGCHGLKGPWSGRYCQFQIVRVGKVVIDMTRLPLAG